MAIILLVYAYVLRWLSVILYIVFLFLVITIMLNLLIAQMSDTYSNEKDDAQRSFVMNRAWIVAKAENNSLVTSLLVRSITLNYKVYYLATFLPCRNIGRKVTFLMS